MRLKSIITICIAVGTCVLVACNKKSQRTKPSLNMPISLSKPAKGDKAVYGLACMGCTDSTIVLLPNAGGNPVRYNILTATRNRQVFGDIEIGDWICLLRNEKDSLKADMVVDLDNLKATWTYQVMPHLRDVKHLSKRQQARILANMPDSIVDTYMVPREHGFALQRMGEASPIGYERPAVAEEDDCPVEYPEVPFYTEWHPYNGKLILVRSTRPGIHGNQKIARDTMTFIYMKGDSLALQDKKGIIYGYHKSSQKAQ